MELVRNDVNIVRVKTKQEMKDFIHVTDDIYCNCPQYVPDWEQDLVDFFVPEKNPGLDFSDVQAFVAYRDEIAVGRIVGIINHRANERWQSKNVRFSKIDYETLRVRCRKANRRLSEYIRESALQSEVVMPHTTENASLYRELAGMANNLNQLARLSHQTSLYHTSRKVDEVLERVLAIISEYKQGREGNG